MCGCRALTLVGLTVIAMGTGGIKPCVSAFGGDQFQESQVTESILAQIMVQCLLCRPICSDDSFHYSTSLLMLVVSFLHCSLPFLEVSFQAMCTYVHACL